MTQCAITWLLILSVVLPLTSAKWIRMEINRSAVSESAWKLFQRHNRNRTTLPAKPISLPFGNERPLPGDALLPPQQMLFLLGPRAYNPLLVSVAEPWEHLVYPWGRLAFPHQRENATAEVLTRVKMLKRYTRRKRQISKKKLDRLRAVYAACPLQQTWRDYGLNYWPRWVKEGKCVNLGNTSCSLPPGMFCQPHEETTVVLLRYICPQNWATSKCNWYRMQVPLLTSCKCGCRK